MPEVHKYKNKKAKQAEARYLSVRELSLSWLRDVVDVPVVTGAKKAYPASGGLFDGMEKASAEELDVLMIRYCVGRLQNKDNLMAELERLVVLSSVWSQKHPMKPLPWMPQQVKMPLVRLRTKITPLTGLVFELS